MGEGEESDADDMARMCNAGCLLYACQLAEAHSDACRAAALDAIEAALLCSSKEVHLHALSLGAVPLLWRLSEEDPYDEIGSAAGKPARLVSARRPGGGTAAGAQRLTRDAAQVLEYLEGDWDAMTRVAEAGFWPVKVYVQLGREARGPPPRRRGFGFGRGPSDDGGPRRLPRLDDDGDGDPALL